MYVLQYRWLADFVSHQYSKIIAPSHSHDYNYSECSAVSSFRTLTTVGVWVGTLQPVRASVHLESYTRRTRIDGNPKGCRNFEFLTPS